MKLIIKYNKDNLIAMSFPWPITETNPKRLNRIDVKLITINHVEIFEKLTKPIHLIFIFSK
jgi:hypothetical protein